MRQQLGHISINVSGGSNLWILETTFELATASAVADNIQNPIQRFDPHAFSETFRKETHLFALLEAALKVMPDSAMSAIEPHAIAL